MLENNITNILKLELSEWLKTWRQIKWRRRETNKIPYGQTITLLLTTIIWCINIWCISTIYLVVLCMLFYCASACIRWTEENIANPLISVIKTWGKKRGGMGWSITWSFKVLASNLSLQVSSLSKFLWKLKRVLRILVAQVFLLALFLGYSCIIVFLVCLSLHLCSWFQVACFSIQFAVFIKFYYHEITILLIL